MGFYPNRSYVHMPDGTVLETHTEPGLKKYRTLTPSEWIEERDDCYCCTCPRQGSGLDPYCRNHGWDGRRPCDMHSLPGQLDGSGEMPLSVQAYRRTQF